MKLRTQMDTMQARLQQSENARKWRVGNRKNDFSCSAQSGNTMGCAGLRLTCSDANTLANILTSTWMESRSVLQAQKATSWAQRFHQESSNSDEKLLLRHNGRLWSVNFQQLLVSSKKFPWQAATNLLSHMAM